MKVRIRDEERAQKTSPLTMVDPPTGIPTQQADAVLGTVRITTPGSLAKTKANKEETTREVNANKHPAEDDPTNQTPMLFDWAKDVDESNGLSLAIPTDTKPTTRVDKAMAEAPPTPTSPVADVPRMRQRSVKIGDLSVNPMRF